MAGTSVRRIGAVSDCVPGMNFIPAAEAECPVIGHSKVRVALEQELPLQPVLLLGPESTGKWLMVKWAANYHAPWYHQRCIAQPTMDAIRELRGFLLIPPSLSDCGSGCKVVAVNLDGVRSGQGVQNALLKDLEEFPDYVRFLLVASRVPLATVSSRCIIWRGGELTDEEVAQVLVRKGVPLRDAMVIAPGGRGRVQPALDAAERFRPAKAVVLKVVRALVGRDYDLFERAVKDWGKTEDWMLRELLGAAASGNSTSLFSNSERQVIGSTAARKGIALLPSSSRMKPQVAVRVLAIAFMER